MKKIWKKIAAIVAVTCLALCGLLLAACGNGGQAEYDVSVTYQSGKAVPELKVIFTPDAEGKETAEGVTDEEGKFTVRLYTEMNYTVAAENLPDDFILQTKKIYTAKGSDIQLKIVLPETYSFEVTGPEGADLSGITVSYSATPTGERTPLGQTDADGKFTAKMEPTEGYAFIDAPEGYVYNEKYTDDTYRLNSRLKMNFELIAFEEISLDTVMTDEEIKAFRDETQNTVFGEMMESTIRKAYSFRKTNEELEAKRVYSFQAKETGEYWLFANFEGGLEMSVSGNLNLNDAINFISGSFKHFSVLCEEGNTYYVSVEADTTQQDLQFLIVSPKESNQTLVTGVGDVEISILEKLPAEISFQPIIAGKYTFAVQGNVRIEVISNSYITDSSDSGTLSFDVTTDNLYYGDGTPSNVAWLLRFTALDENPVYPVNITVSISRENIVEYRTEVKTIQVTDQLSKYADGTGKLIAVGVNNTNGQIVKGADGYYHYGSESGPVVVIKLTGRIETFYEESDFDKLEEEADGFFRFYLGKDDEKHVYNYENYSAFFHTYAAFVNGDGVYPLTEELVSFLKRVAEKNASFFKTCVSAYSEDSLWLFSAFYYAE